MPAINLIPAFRLRAKAKRRHLRRWAVRLGGYALMLVAACFVRLSRAGGGPEALAAQERLIGESLDTHTKAIQALKGDLAEARQKLHSLRLVGRQPDWGLLFKLVGAQMGDNVVLDNCSLHHVAETGAAGNDRSKQVLWFDIGGIARTEKEVSDFILRLETSGLFAEVKHVNTSQRAFHGQKAFGFQLKCRLACREEGPAK